VLLRETREIAKQHWHPAQGKPIARTYKLQRETEEKGCQQETRLGVYIFFKETELRACQPETKRRVYLYSSYAVGGAPGA
jgi:hypothetical protein